MDRAKPIAVNVTADLTASYVVRFFREHPHKDLKAAFPPLKPKGGEVPFSQRMIAARVS